MRILQQKDLIKNITRNINKYQKISFSVAFATKNNIIHLLLENETKLTQCTFGLDNLITSPEVIELLMPTKKVKFIESTKGIFHPKIYFFENSKSDWVCISGSSNLTIGGIKKNNEFNMLCDNTDDNQNKLYFQIKKAVKENWEIGQLMSQSQIEVYKNKRFNTNIQPKKNIRKSKSDWRIDLLTWDWEKFYKKVNEDKYHKIHERTELLSKIRRILHNKKFNEIDELNRSMIAGYNGPPKSNWGWFGSMKPVGDFMSIVKANNPLLGEAIDEFPSSGTVLELDVLRFREKYKKALEGKRQGITPLTRLLTMKRPDTFVCITSANKKKLKKSFGYAPTSSVDNLERYWEEIILKIQSANWYNSPEPKKGIEKQVWLGRAAFLDSMFYNAK